MMQRRNRPSSALKAVLVLATALCMAFVAVPAGAWAEDLVVEQEPELELELPEEEEPVLEPEAEDGEEVVVLEDEPSIVEEYADDAYSAPESATAKGNSEDKTATNPSVLYRVHRQTYGWETSWKKDGQQSGTTGQSKRLEGIYIKLANKPVSGGITYRTHVQKIGWQGWKSNGAMSGTSGKSLRLEAIQIKLTGNMAKKYDVYYRVHAQKFGWMGWAKNGAKSGTAGYAYRLEAIQIVLVKKGGKAPAANFGGARRTTTAAFRQKTYTNVDAHRAYMNKLKAIKRAAPSFDNNVYYAYIDIYGSRLDELVCVSRINTGSGRALRIYTFAGGKVKQLLDDGMYGDNWYEFYKSCKSFVMYCSGHGGEMYRYFQVSSGQYKEVAYMSRQSTAGGGSYDGPWSYYIGSTEVSESRFNNYTINLIMGDVGHLPSHYDWSYI